jgi:hypothetical protein
MAVMAGINLELAANLLDKPKDEFHPEPLAPSGLASRRQSRWRKVRSREAGTMC